MTERRIENRFACADLVRVDWLEGEDHFHTTEAVLEDISRTGACVQLDNKIQLGATIIITLAQARFSGHVCYCVYRDYGWFIGIRFSEDTTWSSRKAAPAHLTDLRIIAALGSGS